MGGLKEDERGGAPGGPEELEGGDLESSRGGEAGSLLTLLSGDMSTTHTKVTELRSNGTDPVWETCLR